MGLCSTAVQQPLFQYHEFIILKTGEKEGFEPTSFNTVDQCSPHWATKIRNFVSTHIKLESQGLFSFRRTWDHPLIRSPDSSDPMKVWSEAQPENSVEVTSVEAFQDSEKAEKVKALGLAKIKTFLMNGS